MQEVLKLTSTTRNPLTRSETMASTSKLKTTVGRALRGDPADQTVHFHLSSDGRPFACDVHACDSAALTLGDLRLMHEVAQ